jgi:hypothetical protein
MRPSRVLMDRTASISGTEIDLFATRRHHETINKEAQLAKLK